MKEKLIYEKGSETIRQIPQNYCLAHKENKAWVMRPDLACNKKFAIKLFTMLFDFDILYGTGENLIDKFYNGINLKIKL